MSWLAYTSLAGKFQFTLIRCEETFKASGKSSARNNPLSWSTTKIPFIDRNAVPKTTLYIAVASLVTLAMSLKVFSLSPNCIYV